VKDFRAYRIDQQDGKVVADFTTLNIDDLSAGEVVIKVSHSTINYKDALAATGKGKILRTFPLVGGIDLAGSVVSSDDARLSEGDAVLVNGCGLSETCDGGYAGPYRLAWMPRKQCRSVPPDTRRRWPSTAWNKTIRRRTPVRLW
jgi:NADPH2:quinone reductase